MSNATKVHKSSSDTVRIGVIGLGYVGLPLCLAFSEEFIDTVGFDIDTHKVEQIKQGQDPCGEGFEEKIRASCFYATSKVEDLKNVTFYVVTVPTPLDSNNFPDLKALQGACRTVGSTLDVGNTVVFESTVYPGLTEEVCVPLLEQASGLRSGHDFFVGYSPERVNPGDKEHTLTSIVKVVAGEDDATAHLLERVYGKIIKAGVKRASSIRIAEAAKVIENTQRDINIALMNELAIICDKLDIPTHEVLKVASTKWNFMPFTPGLVGGHCIGVDPYYLTAKAQQIGYHPQVILAGRKINDGMGVWVAQRAVKFLANNGRMIQGAKVGILGLTFKEDVCDVRNSRVPDIVQELKEFGIAPIVFDPHASTQEVDSEYGIKITSLEEFSDLECLILAVPHTFFREMGYADLSDRLVENGIFMDLKSVFHDCTQGSSAIYWSL